MTLYRQVVLPCSVANKRGILQWTKDGFGLGIQRDLPGECGDDDDDDDDDNDDDDDSVPGYPRYKMVGEEEAGEFSLEISRLDTEDDAVFQCQVRTVTVMCHMSHVTCVPNMR